MEHDYDIERRILDQALQLAITGAHTVPACIAARLSIICAGVPTDRILLWCDEAEMVVAIRRLRDALVHMAETIRGEEVRA
jgi:hypothetical protein